MGLPIRPNLHAFVVTTFKLVVGCLALLTAPIAGAAEWTVDLKLENGNRTENLTFGAASGATAGFDAGIDSLMPPPAFTYYAAFQISGPASYLARDLRAAQRSNHDWILIITNANTITSMIKWDLTNLLANVPDPVITIGNTDMRTVDSLVVTGNQSLTIHFESGGCANDGDVNADGVLTPGDALCAFNIFLNNQVLTTACDVTGFQCEVAAADVNCDATVTPGDALAIFQRFLNGLPPEICFASSRAKLPPAANEARLILSANFYESTGNSLRRIELTMRLDNAGPVTAFGMKLQCPRSIVGLAGVERGGLTTSWDQLDGRLHDNGELILGGFTSGTSQSRDGELVKIVLEIANNTALPALEDFRVPELIGDLKGAVLFAAPSDDVSLSQQPLRFALHPSFPNPSRLSATGVLTTLAYEVSGSEPAPVELSIYDLQGRLVSVLVAHTQAPGPYQVSWDGRDQFGRTVAAAIYYVRLRAGDLTASRMLSVIK